MAEGAPEERFQYHNEILCALTARLVQRRGSRRPVEGGIAPVCIALLIYFRRERGPTPRGGPAMRLTPWWLLLSAVLWVSSARMVHAGDNVWTSLGPEGGPVLALALDPLTPTTLYAGTDGSGVFK